MPTSLAAARRHYQPLLGLLADIDDERIMHLPPLATGFTPLDPLLDGGFRAHELTLVAGKPAVGKTVITLQWARNVVKAGGHCAFISFEHSQESLIGRLLNMELSETDVPVDETTRESLRRRIRDWISGTCTSAELLATHPALATAHEALTQYATRLFLVRASLTSTDLGELSTIARHVVGYGGLMIVDYLQKVPLDTNPIYRAQEVAAGLKEIAMADHVSVVAIAAVSEVGLEQRRIRLHHLDRSAPLIHECDLAMLLNDKAAAISQVHVAYDTRRLEDARDTTLLSVEKNREGPASIHLEFRKEFEGFRFDPRGSFVTDHLVGDPLYDS
ncbi:MAG: AAA family ATPase [Acidimicrobiales bacterium]|nr:AAA family ATPase [Acidimicrobiales bacterium]